MQIKHRIFKRTDMQVLHYLCTKFRNFWCITRLFNTTRAYKLSLSHQYSKTIRPWPTLYIPSRERFLYIISTKTTFLQLKAIQIFVILKSHYSSTLRTKSLVFQLKTLRRACSSVPDKLTPPHAIAVRRISYDETRQ